MPIGTRRLVSSFLHYDAAFERIAAAGGANHE